MNTGSTDAKLREAFRQMAPPVDVGSLYKELESRLSLAEEASRSSTPRLEERPDVQEPVFSRRRRSGLRVAVFASVAVALVAATIIGSLVAARYLGDSTTIVYITDETTATSATTTTEAATSTTVGRMGELVWKFQTGGRVRSAPALSDGVIYFGSEDGYLYALDPQTGAEKWRFKTGGAVWSSPAVSDGMVYFGSDDNYLYAVDLQTGAEKWKFKTGGRGLVLPGRLRWSGLRRQHGRLFLRRRRPDGTEKWKFQTGNQITDSPAVSDGVVCFGSFDQYLYALDAQTGAEKWKFKTNDAQVGVPGHLRWRGLLRRGGARRGAGHRALRAGSPDRRGEVGRSRQARASG